MTDTRPTPADQVRAWLKAEAEKYDRFAAEREVQATTALTGDRAHYTYNLAARDLAHAHRRAMSAKAATELIKRVATYPDPRDLRAFVGLRAAELLSDDSMIGDPVADAFHRAENEATGGVLRDLILFLNDLIAKTEGAVVDVHPLIMEINDYCAVVMEDPTPGDHASGKAAAAFGVKDLIDESGYLDGVTPPVAAWVVGRVQAAMTDGEDEGS